MIVSGQPNQVRWILWSRFSWRHWRYSLISSMLLLCILAVGVAAFFSIRLANQAAVESFRSFTGLITSQSDGIVSAPAGTLPDATLLELRGILKDEPVNLVPVLEATAAAPKTDENEALGSRANYQLLGLDLASIANVSSADSAGSGWFESSTSSQKQLSTNRLGNVLRDSRAVFVSKALAARDHLEAGSLLPLLVNEHPVQLEVAGIIPSNPNQPEAPMNLLIMDLPALQKVTDKPGQLDRIELLMEPGPQRAERWRRIESILESSPSTVPRAWTVTSPADRREAASMMTRAFRLNLTILSLLALLVGLYLVFQGLDGAVIRRRNEIAILRSLGVTSHQIQNAWLVESGAIGLAGGMLGLCLGWLGAQVAVKMVGKTVNALYYSTSVNSAAFDLGEAAMALGVSVISSLIAGWIPARVAANRAALASS